MSIRSRLAQLFNRKTAPAYDSNRPLIRIPAKKGGIYITHEKALELSTCFACVRVIAEDIAKLPWNVFLRTGDTRAKVNNRISQLLNTRPNPEMGAFTFRETMMTWTLTWGNGYAEIERDLAGRAVALWPLSPDRVDPTRDSTGRIVYEVTNTYGETTIIPQRDMFHLHGIGYDGLCGYSMVGLAAQTLGFAMAAEEHGASFYGNNTTPGLALKTPAVLNDEGFNRLKAQIEERKGSARAYEGMILEEGLDFARPNMSQVDAQYVESRRQQVEEICRWWRVPPHKVSELSRAHFANVENLNIDYATDTLMPWIKRIEEEADWKLIGNSARQGYYSRIAIQGLMRGDSAARAAYYREMFNMGAFSQNKILELEDMDPIGPEGDEHFLQMNMATLKNIIAKPVEPAVAPASDNGADNQGDAEDPVTAVVRNFAKRFLAYDLKRVRAISRGLDYAAITAWIDDHHQKNNARLQSALADIAPVLAMRYSEVRIDDFIDAYTSAAKEQLISDAYDGPATSEPITAAILNALNHGARA